MRNNQGKKKKPLFLGVDGLFQPRVFLGGDREKFLGLKGGTMGLELEGGRQEISNG